MMNFVPENDGLDHINVYSKGKTDLGRFLSNFTYCEIKTKDGNFNSIEGYWYWLLSDKSEKTEQLRYLCGWKAKQFGRLLMNKDWPEENDIVFKNKITRAIEFKVDNSSFKDKFYQSILPFDHYYVYNELIVKPTQGRWILEFLEDLRKHPIKIIKI